MRNKHTYIKEQVLDCYVWLETNSNLYKLNLGFVEFSCCQLVENKIIIRTRC